MPLPGDFSEANFSDEQQMYLFELTSLDEEGQSLKLLLHLFIFSQKERGELSCASSSGYRMIRILIM